jgi:hypothetical protein
MTNPKKSLALHLSIAILLYVVFASFDIYFTLKGLGGDISLEGNPTIRYMMVNFGIAEGLLLQKTIVLLIAAFIAIVCFRGIDKEADWVYYLALTRLTKNWLKRKKRYWISFLPLYLVALSQGIAAGIWVYILVQ